MGSLTMGVGCPVGVEAMGDEAVPLHVARSDGLCREVISWRSFHLRFDLAPFPWRALRPFAVMCLAVDAGS